MEQVVLKYGMSKIRIFQIRTCVNILSVGMVSSDALRSRPLHKEPKDAIPSSTFKSPPMFHHEGLSWWTESIPSQFVMQQGDKHSRDLNNDVTEDDDSDLRCRSPGFSHLDRSRGGS